MDAQQLAEGLSNYSERGIDIPLLGTSQKCQLLVSCEDKVSSCSNIDLASVESHWQMVFINLE